MSFVLGDCWVIQVYNHLILGLGYWIRTSHFMVLLRWSFWTWIHDTPKVDVHLWWWIQFMSIEVYFGPEPGCPLSGGSDFISKVRPQNHLKVDIQVLVQNRPQ